MSISKKSNQIDNSQNGRLAEFKRVIINHIDKTLLKKERTLIFLLILLTNMSQLCFALSCAVCTVGCLETKLLLFTLTVSYKANTLMIN